MNDQPVWDKPAAVVVRFKSSSSKDGKEGYELAVSSEATEADVIGTMDLARYARDLALRVLADDFTPAPRRPDGQGEPVDDFASIEPDAFEQARPAEAPPFA